LIRAGRDETPATEPLPTLTVDRLVVVDTEPGSVEPLHVKVHAACIGTMAMLGADDAHQVPNIAEAATCIDTEASLVPALGAPLVSDAGGPPPAVACEPADSGDAVACIPAGLVVLGSSDGLGLGEVDTTPERATWLPGFWIDRHEVTVARWRAAIASGLSVELRDQPYANDAPLGTNPFSGAVCSFSSTPLGREDFGLSCISWYGARAFCNFYGGDLPTEAQWEYVASAAGRPYATSFPWGDEPPTCERAVYGRLNVDLTGTAECYDAANPAATFGPTPVNAREGPTGDVTPGTGVVGLGGGLSEWIHDAFAPYAGACWSAAKIASATCEDPDAPLRVIRGGAWWSQRLFTLGALRERLPPGSGRLLSIIGFRCAYPARPVLP
jgi:formylglycine-generating enzyme required for sulfatase activity